MSVITRTVWSGGFTEENATQWDTIKDDFLQAAIASNKVAYPKTPIEGVRFGGQRGWVDMETAEGWKALAEEAAETMNVTVEVTITQ
jgi:hypothetical protein